MIKVFIGEILPEIPHTEILFPNLGNAEARNPFDEKVFPAFTAPVVEIVSTPEVADYLCLPHNYNYLRDKWDYLLKFTGLSEKHSKKILVFFPGDSDEEVPVKNSIVFRNSQYKSKMRPNEIIMPAFAADLGGIYGVEYRNKNVKPVVGFCGWAAFGSSREKFSYFIKNIFSPVVERKGLFFRRKALGILAKSGEVETNFIIRSVFSLSAKTIKMDPHTARKEYIGNIKNSDFTLAPKGDGNFSVRFFEALSLGRIPLLIDTDCPLPLEDEIDYDSLILRIHYSDMKKMPKKVSAFYASLSPEEYLARQKKCREVFEKFLRIDVFFTHVFKTKL